MGITAKEIAVLAGVSRGTVDRALKNRPGISYEQGYQALRTLFDALILKKEVKGPFYSQLFIKVDQSL